MKKKLVAVLLSVAVVLGTAACGNTAASTTGQSAEAGSTAEAEAEAGGSSAASEEGAVETASAEKITIWAWDESFNIKAAQEAAEIYKGVQPNVEVEIVTMAQDDIVAKLNTSLSSGSYEGLPNVVLIEDYRIQGYLTAYPDEFYDLSAIASPKDFAAYKTGVNQVDGKMFGVPFDSGVAGTFYRTDYIEEAGYTQADMQDLTWEKYIEIGMAVKEKTGKHMLTLDPSDLGQIRMMLQSSGAWYTDAEGNVNIEDNESLKAAITVYQKMVSSGIAKEVADWDQFVGAFNNGDVATVPTGCWISPSIQKAADQSGKWAVAPFPKMAADAKSVNASSIGGGGWYVLKNVGNPEIGADFLKNTFASDADLMNTLAAEINLVGTLNAAADCENYVKGLDYYGGQKVFGDFAEWTSQVPSVNYSLHTYAVEDMMTEAVQAIVGGGNMDEVLADYQLQIEAAVAQ